MVLMKLKKTSISKSSEKYPDHMFKIGYFRSSYNDGGIERILSNLSIPTLKIIFDKQNDDDIFQPDWDSALIMVNDSINQLKSSEPYRVTKISSNIFSAPQVKSPADAMKVFLDELGKHSGGESYNYSNSVGEFTTAEPLKVLAFIPGTYSLFHERECVYVITESTNEWYIQALEIVKETIEFVLSQKDKEKYYLHWSG